MRNMVVAEVALEAVQIVAVAQIAPRASMAEVQSLVQAEAAAAEQVLYVQPNRKATVEQAEHGVHIPLAEVVQAVTARKVSGQQTQELPVQVESLVVVMAEAEAVVLMVAVAEPILERAVPEEFQAEAAEVLAGKMLQPVALA